MKNGLYVGSFDMFTNGHLDIIEQSIELFDKIYVVISKNPMKKRNYDIYSMRDIMIDVFKRKEYGDKIEVCISDSLSVRFAESHNCNFLIRGIRNNTDYNYEELLCVTNAELNKNIRTMYFMTRYPYISSTFVREMNKHGEDVSKYLPYNINNLRSESK